MGWRCEVCLVTNDEDTKVCVCCEYAREQNNSKENEISGPIFNINTGKSEEFPVFKFGVPSSNIEFIEGNTPAFPKNQSIGFVPNINSCELTPSTPLNTPLIQNIKNSDKIFTKDDEKNSYFNDFKRLYHKYKDNINNKPNINENIRSNKLKIPTGSVWVWGSGECDQLGIDESLLDEDLSLKSPMKIEKMSNEHKIIDICSGALHNLVLTDEGKILSWGCNDDGALGRISQKFRDKLNKNMDDNEENDEHTIEEDNNDQDGDKYPDLIEFQDNNVKVKSVICGDCYSCCLTDKGEVYLWGSYKDSGGYIGFPDYNTMSGSIKSLKQYTPVKLPMFGPTGNCNVKKKLRLEKKNIIIEMVDKIVGGENHTLVITKNNRVFAWGSTEFGQFAIKPVENKILKTNYLYPIELTKESLGFETHFEIQDIYCGRATTFFVLRNNIKNCIEIYACGRNGRNELGIEFNNSNHEFNPIISKPRKVNICDFDLICLKCQSNKVIKTIGGGQYYSALLTCCGEVYTWGMKECCGLDMQNFNENKRNQEKDIKIPTKINHLNNIKTLGFGADCCFATDNNGLLYVWGMNLTGQIGIKSLIHLDTIYNPHIMNPEVFDSYKINNYTIKVTGGSQHSIALIWNGLYSEIENKELILDISDSKRKLKRMNAKNFDEELEKIDVNNEINNIDKPKKNKSNKKSNQSDAKSVIKKTVKSNNTKLTKKNSKNQVILKSDIDFNNKDSKITEKKKVKDKFKLESDNKSEIKDGTKDQSNSFSEKNLKINSSINDKEKKKRNITKSKIKKNENADNDNLDSKKKVSKEKINKKSEINTKNLNDTSNKRNTKLKSNIKNLSNDDLEREIGNETKTKSLKKTKNRTETLDEIKNKDQTITLKKTKNDNKTNAETKTRNATKNKSINETNNKGKTKDENKTNIKKSKDKNKADTESKVKKNFEESKKPEEKSTTRTRSKNKNSDFK